MAAIDRPAAENPRKRVLADSEVVEIWHALTKEGGRVERVGKLLLLLVQRRGEVTGMRLSEVRGLQRNEAGCLEAVPGVVPAWEIPGERVKNHRDHVVPLTKQAIALLGNAGVYSDLMFTSDGTTPMWLGSKIKAKINKHIADARAKAGIKETMPAWNWHDFRRTGATGMGRLRISRFIQDRVTNHVDASIGGVYDRYDYFDEKLAALQAWGDYVEALLAKDRGNVVTLHTPDQAAA